MDKEEGSLVVSHRYEIDRFPLKNDSLQITADQRFNQPPLQSHINGYPNRTRQSHV
ncbi:hypothetical protein YC2023_120099 [Brassica napus]